MNIQTPASRATDPVSSHLAEAHINKGSRAHQQNLAASAVRQFPGRTSLELARDACMDRYTLARRLPECEVAGTVRRGQIVTCSVSGRKAMLWWST